MIPDGDGGYTCKACGATETDIKCCEAMIIADWQSGGSGVFSKNRYKEIKGLHEDREGAD